MTASEIRNTACGHDALRLITRRAGHSRGPGRPAQLRRAKSFKARADANAEAGSSPRAGCAPRSNRSV